MFLILLQVCGGGVREGRAALLVVDLVLYCVALLLLLLVGCICLCYFWYLSLLFLVGFYFDCKEPEELQGEYLWKSRLATSPPAA